MHFKFFLNACQMCAYNFRFIYVEKLFFCYTMNSIVQHRILFTRVLTTLLGLLV